MKKLFDKKVIKLSLDVGATCPNRDGTLSHRGCIFCGEQGAGEFAGVRGDRQIPIQEKNKNIIQDDYKSIEHQELHLSSPILEQLAAQKALTQEKWPDALFLAYFQNYSNTYCPVDKLQGMCEEVLKAGEVLDIPIVGIALATRPDCLPDDILEYLSKLSRKTFVWVELGLQTANDRTGDFLRRGYPLATYLSAAEKLNRLGIRHVCHLILGLPGETLDDFKNSLVAVIRAKAFGVKLHPLFIQRDTDLANLYLRGDFDLLTIEDLLDWLIFGLEHLPPDMTIHRLTGDASWKLHLAPDYALDKRKVLNGLLREMKARGTWQGRLYGPVEEC